VHGHWLLVRLLRLFPGAPFAARARAALDRHLTPDNLAAETAYLTAAGRETLERPYGLAWLLQLDAELHEWHDPQGERWAKAVSPLAHAVVARMTTWLPKLTHPVRIGEHNQTAFSLGLALDWARAAGDPAAAALFVRRAQDLYGNDQACPLAYEPSGEDFLSPCLAEADLMRRILPPPAFAPGWAASCRPSRSPAPRRATGCRSASSPIPPTASWRTSTGSTCRAPGCSKASPPGFPQATRTSPPCAPPPPCTAPPDWRP
jgi:Protein of unknown function (DUF2891)